MNIDQPQPAENVSPGAQPRGLSGWLVLPLLGLALTPIAGVAYLWAFIQAFANWSFLSGVQLVFINVEMMVNAAMLLVAPIALLFLAFRYSALFPGLYVIWAGLMPGVNIVDAVVGYLVFSEVFAATGEQMFDSDTVSAIGGSIWRATIWIPYIILSKRVENTFTR